LRPVLQQYAARQGPGKRLAARLGWLLHDSFQMIDDQGNRSTRRQELARAADSAWDPGTFEYRIERLDIYDGRWAIIDGSGIAETYRYKSSNILIKEDGRWQAVASHVSGHKEHQESRPGQPPGLYGSGIPDSAASASQSATLSSATRSIGMMPWRLTDAMS